MKNSVPSIDEEVKRAERDKYLAETNKAISERNKIDHELGEAIKEAAKPFWLKKDFRNSVIGIFIGLGVLGFYIVYAVLPVVNRDNLLLSIENAKAQKKLQDGRDQLSADSIVLKNKETILLRQIKYNDSLKKITDRQKIENNELMNARHKVDSSFSVFRKLSLIKNLEDSKSLVNSKNNLNEYISKYNDLVVKYEAKSSSIPLLPISGLTGSTSLSSYTGKEFLKPFSGDSLWQNITKDNYSFIQMPGAKIKFRPIYNGKIINNLKIIVNNHYVLGNELIASDDYSYSLPIGRYDVSINDNNYNIAEIISSAPDDIKVNPLYLLGTNFASNVPTLGSSPTIGSQTLTNQQPMSYFVNYNLSITSIPNQQKLVDLLLVAK